MLHFQQSDVLNKEFIRYLMCFPQFILHHPQQGLWKHILECLHNQDAREKLWFLINNNSNNNHDELLYLLLIIKSIDIDDLSMRVTVLTETENIAINMQHFDPWMIFGKRNWALTFFSLFIYDKNVLGCCHPLHMNHKTFLL